MNQLFMYINRNNPDEYFGKVNYNNIILSDYYISNYGRVWSIRWNRFLSQSPDKDGYLRVGIVINGKNKTVKVHRLILMTFSPIEYPEKYIGNHKDGIKNHNYLYNLEWSTPMENTRHGWDTGLNQNIGEGNVISKLSDEEAHTICRALENGESTKDICDRFGITDKKERMKMQSIISSILLFKTHRNISRQYNLPGSKGRDRYSLEFAHLVSHFIINGYTDIEIMDHLQIPEMDRPKFKVYLSDLIRGRTALEINKLYNLSSFNDHRKQN